MRSVDHPESPLLHVALQPQASECIGHKLHLSIVQGVPDEKVLKEVSSYDTVGLDSLPQCFLPRCVLHASVGVLSHA